MEQSERNIRNSVVCVIGGCGFLGSHLVDYLIEERECEVIVLDNLISGDKKFLHPKARFIWCDVTQSEQRIKNILAEHKIEYVFNYVAEPYIPVSFERPLHVFDTNARAALMIINAAQEAGVRAILQISSAEIYGDAPDGQVNEEWWATPHSTYGASKLAIDALVQARWKEAKTPCIALRQFNCVGERETHPYVIPEIINQIQNAEVEKDGSKIIKLGNDSFRDFQYAGDAVRMAVELLEKGEFGEVYNMGSQEGIQIYTLAKLIGVIMNTGVSIVEDASRARPWEIWHLQSDNTKLYSVIAYRPQVNLEEALKRTVNYFISNGNKWDF